MGQLQPRTSFLLMKFTHSLASDYRLLAEEQHASDCSNYCINFRCDAHENYNISYLIKALKVIATEPYTKK